MKRAQLGPRTSTRLSLMPHPLVHLKAFCPSFHQPKSDSFCSEMPWSWNSLGWIYLTIGRPATRLLCFGLAEGLWGPCSGLRHQGQEPRLLRPIAPVFAATQPSDPETSWEAETSRFRLEDAASPMSSARVSHKGPGTRWSYRPQKA